MTSISSDLPATDVVEPGTREEIVAIIRENADRREPIYPVGGGTSLDYGLPAREAGKVVQLSKLSQVVDYPARDMTITVEAGITMEALQESLSAQNQELPIDVPRADRASLGGVMATDFSGPRRYGHGTARDYVIGIRAVDGRGQEFAGGGRVVKNVAGYDFCKLLIGSMGTLGVITEVTLKVKPRSARRSFVGCPIDHRNCESVLASLPQSQTYPSVIAWIGGPHWQNVQPLAKAAGGSDWIVVAFEGTDPEVSWMTEALLEEWRALEVAGAEAWSDADSEGLFKEMVEFPQRAGSPLTVQASLVPSGLTALVDKARQLDPNCSILTHAGNGIVYIRFHEIPESGMAATLTRHLRPVATMHHGSVVLLSGNHREEWTRQLVWGGIDAPLTVMNEIKKQFDPHAILNPGRFVYS